jgi:hypothetical protein
MNIPEYNHQFQTAKIGMQSQEQVAEKTQPKEET